MLCLPKYGDKFKDTTSYPSDLPQEDLSQGDSLCSLVETLLGNDTLEAVDQPQQGELEDEGSATDESKT